MALDNILHPNSYQLYLNDATISNLEVTGNLIVDGTSHLKGDLGLDNNIIVGGLINGVLAGSSPNEFYQNTGSGPAFSSFNLSSIPHGTNDQVLTTVGSSIEWADPTGNNIYNSDGTLSANRNLFQAGNNLTFNAGTTEITSLQGTNVSIIANQSSPALTITSPTIYLPVVLPNDNSQQGLIAQDGSSGELKIVYSNTIPTLYSSDGTLALPRTVHVQDILDWDLQTTAPFGQFQVTGASGSQLNFTCDANSATIYITSAFLNLNSSNINLVEALSNDDTQDQVLVRNSSTNYLQYRNATSLPGKLGFCCLSAPLSYTSGIVVVPFTVSGAGSWDDGTFDSINHQYTISKTGIYNVSYSLEFTSAIFVPPQSYYINGDLNLISPNNYFLDSVANYGGISAQIVQCGASSNLLLNAGDTYQITFFSSLAGGSLVNDQCYFSMRYLGDS